MKKCCDTTFRLAMEEVLLTIEQHKINSVQTLVKLLQNTVRLLKEQGKVNEL
jgi:hypothetical protein